MQVLSDAQWHVLRPYMGNQISTTSGGAAAWRAARARRLRQVVRPKARVPSNSVAVSAATDGGPVRLSRRGRRRGGPVGADALVR